MDSIYGGEWQEGSGWEVGTVGWEVGAGGEPKAGFSIHWSRKAASWKCKKGQNAKKVVGSSFTPSVALLVHPSGTVHYTEDCHELNMMPIKQTLLYVALSMLFLNSTRAWLSCPPKNLISVLALLRMSGFCKFSHILKSVNCTFKVL